MIEIVRPGIQSTLQGAPRVGYRHMGVPWSGAADNWSMALANRLVGNSAVQTALEISYGSFAARILSDTWFALTGAPAPLQINRRPAEFHTVLFAPAGSLVEIGAPENGIRIYLAVAGGIKGESFLGSVSTYLPAGFGGHEGRALEEGDMLDIASQPRKLEYAETPAKLRPAISGTYAVRACASAETDLLSARARSRLFDAEFSIGRQATRMGVTLEGPSLELNSDGKMKSAGVFPGIIQCPENGTPIILLSDAQTTGGYPRIASVASCDRHMLGQLRPGDKVRLLKRSHMSALADLEAKLSLLRSWVPDFEM